MVSEHPRDLFDARDLLSHEGIDDNLRKAFIVYLLSHDRPMAEVLAPARLDIAAEYKRGFEGMVDKPVTLDELLQAREALIAEIVGKMPEKHRRFLISVKRGEHLAVLASRFTQFRRSGRQLVGLCPLHSERHPSFYVHPEKQVFHCFGCGAGGDLYAFVMRVNNCDFRRALEIVAEFSQQG
jgi:hypothetical protein